VRLILKHLLLAFVKHLHAHPVVSPRLRKADRVLLSYLIYFYSDQLTLESMKEAISKMQIPWWKRLLAGVFNQARLPLNYASTVLENALKRYRPDLRRRPVEKRRSASFPEIKIARRRSSPGRRFLLSFEEPERDDQRAAGSKRSPSSTSSTRSRLENDAGSYRASCRCSARQQPALVQHAATVLFGNA
jgi:hypothetical protein